MDAPFYLGMTKEDRHDYAAYLANQYVESAADADAVGYCDAAGNYHEYDD